MWGSLMLAPIKIVVVSVTIAPHSSECIVQSSSLTNLMRYLVEHKSNHRAETKRQALGNGCSKRQTISKVVNSISKDNQPCKRLDVQYVMPHSLETILRGRLCVCVCVHVRVCACA